MRNSSHQPLLNSITLAMLLCFTVNAQADGFSLNDANTKKIKKDKWVCKYCPEISNSVAKITASINHTSDNNGRFATDVGDNDDGVGAQVDANLDKRTTDSHYLFSAQGLGQDNSKAKLLVSKTGSYKAVLNYATLNQFGHHSALTPFTNPGKSSLTLPSDWQRVATTSAMPFEDFNTFAEQLERESWQLTLDKQFTSNWQGYVDVNNQDQQGINTTSGNILNKIVMLPTGIEQQHEQLDVGTFVAYEYGTLMLNYYKSDFSNKRKAINWHSPYSVLFGGANGGQLSTAPDNQFDQISVFGNFHHNNIDLQARFNFGQLSQKEPFLPYSDNALLSTNMLAANHLNGDIDTLSSHIKLQYKANKQWRITLDYQLDDRDNNTLTNEYQHLLTDSVLFDDVSVNRPYSFKKTQMKLFSQYRFAIGSQLTFGWQSEQRERDLQDRNKTESDKLWLKVSTRFEPFNDVSFELSREIRDGSVYGRVDQTSPISNNLRLQKYYQADREREQAKGQLSLNPFSASENEVLLNTELSLQAYFSRDQYQQTDIGLVESKRRGIDVSLNTAFNKHFSVQVYSHNQWQNNISQGSYWFENIDWSGDQDDKSDSTGINLMAEKLSDGKLSMGIDYTYTYAIGTTHVNAMSLSDESHNELIINSQNIKVYADYSYSPSLDLHVDLLYQQFNEQDWRFDYNESRLITVLGNDLSNYNYDVYRLTAGISYQF